MTPPKAILYYSHNVLPLEMEGYFQRKLLENVKGIPIVSVMKKARSDFSGKFASENLLIDHAPNNGASILRQMQVGIDAILGSMEDAVVYLAEHDVLYAPSYFLNVPDAPEVLLKNRELYFMNREGFFGPHGKHIHSQTIGWARLLRRCLDEDVQQQRKFKSEQGYALQSFDNDLPSVDVRHFFNFSGYREAKSAEAYLRRLPHWGEHAALANEIPGFFLRAGKSRGTA